MTQLDLFDQKAAQSENTIDHYRRLMEALAPDPSAWEYRGECNDLGAPLGACACGHPIRFEFVIHCLTRKAVLGSTCIEHFQALNPKLFADLTKANDELLQRIAEAKKAAAEAERQVKVEHAKAIYLATRQRAADKFLAYKNSGHRAPYLLWKLIESNYYALKAAPAYKRSCDFIRWYTDKAKLLEQAIAEAN